MTEVRARSRIRLPGEHEAAFTEDDLVLHRRQSLPYHPNGMRFSAFNRDDQVVRTSTCYSIGGGFVVDEPAATGIERNAMAAVQAINAARIALQGSGTHLVSLDTVIATRGQTGADMRTK